ncbi:MAG: hypothetical protein RMJ14_04340 [Nitrososphaerota archaeon]|nr:hypothetical protein [Aigarchaeota archaeon]MDW8076847.1 hypothetical protein [Nitrososphaerota archaeon]
MEIISINSSKRFVRLMPETTLDLLNLYRMLSEGDVIYSDTSREIKKQRADGKIDSERVRVTIGVKLEKKSLDPLMRRLRLLGRITYTNIELDLIGKHHSLNVSVGSELGIMTDKDFSRLESFAEYYRKLGKTKKLLCILLDDEQFTIASLSNSGIEVVHKGRFVSQNKDRPDEHVKSIENIYTDIAETIERKLRMEDPIVVVLGSEIAVENFLKFLKKEKERIFKTIKKVGHVSDGSLAGIQEALRNKLLEDIAKSIKPVRDAEVVENFIDFMSKNWANVAIGFEEVYKAVELGAVKDIIVVEDFIWTNIHDKKFEKIMDLVDERQIEMHIVLPDTEAGDKIKSLGGIVSILKYPVKLNY